MHRADRTNELNLKYDRRPHALELNSSHIAIKMNDEPGHDYFNEYRLPREEEDVDEVDDIDGEDFCCHACRECLEMIQFNVSDDDMAAEDDQYGRIAYLSKCEELGITPVSQVLRFLETEEMQVMHYGLGGKGTLALVAGISSNTMVTTLRLMDNNIDDSSLTVLIRSLASKPSITELNISGNKIGSNGCQALAEILEKGSALQVVGLSKMHISDKDGARVLAVLENNNVLKALDLSHNELGMTIHLFKSLFISYTHSLLHLCSQGTNLPSQRQHLSKPT